MDAGKTTQLNRNQMIYYVESANKRGSLSLKNLSDADRKTLKVMSDAIREGKDSISVGKDSLTRIEKTFTMRLIPDTSFLEKIIKVYNNIFNDRITSASLAHELAATSLQLKNKEIESKENKLSEMIKNSKGTQAEKDNINALVKEICKLASERAKLEAQANPHSKSQKEIAQFKKEIPGLIRQSKKDSLNLFQKDFVDQVKSESKDLKSTQFEKDYVRAGVSLTVSDRTKPKHKFVGDAYPPHGTSLEERLESHNQAFDKLFGPGEENWKQLTKAGVDQRAGIALMDPLINKFRMSADYNQKKIKIAGNECFIISASESTSKNAQINRDGRGKITSVDVQVKVLTPLLTGVSYKFHERPIDFIGYIESTMTYTLKLKNGEPDVSDIQYNHVFTEEPPKPPQVGKPPEEEGRYMRPIRSYESKLDEIKADTTGTINTKMFLVDRYIADIRVMVDGATTENESKAAKALLKKYQDYFDTL